MQAGYRDSNVALQKVSAERQNHNRAALGSVAPVVPDADHPPFLQAAEVLRRQWLEITVATMIVVAIVAIYSFKMKPVYRATSRLEIDAETPMLQSLVENLRNPQAEAIETFLVTQTQVLASDNLAWQTIEQLHLADNPAFTGNLPRRREGSSDDPYFLRNHLTRLFGGDLSVDLRRNSHVVNVGFESTDPRIAAHVVNALVENYIEYNFRTKYDATRQASGWMEQQLDEMKATVERSQQTLVDYERANSMVTSSDKGRDGADVSEHRLSELTSDLTKAQDYLAEKQALYQQANANPNAIALLAQDDLLQSFEEKSTDINALYIDASTAYGPKFPKVVRLKQQLDQIQTLIRDERNRQVERIRRDYEAALGREKLLLQRIEEQKLEVGRMQQLSIQHNLLKRDFETNQQLYQNLLTTLKDATVTAGLRATNIHVVDSAVPPSAPIRPKKALYLALGLMGGLTLGTALAFARDSVARSRITVRTPEEVQKFLNLPALALIPAWRPNGGRQHYPLAKPNSAHVEASQTDGGKPTAPIVLSQPTSAIAESYRALRTSIRFSSADRPPRVLLVTSSQPKEGKTFTAMNLATVVAPTTSRVLLVDCDMRAPKVASKLGLREEKGISGVLSGVYEAAEAIQEVEGCPHLWVLPCGPRPPNPAELLASQKMQFLIQEFREQFDQIVIDSPPVLLVTDAALLAPLTDGVVLVLESGALAPTALVRAHGILCSTGARVLGVAINKVDFAGEGYYGGYYGYGRYGSGYGHGYGYGASE